MHNFCYSFRLWSAHHCEPVATFFVNDFFFFTYKKEEEKKKKKKRIEERGAVRGGSYYSFHL